MKLLIVDDEELTRTGVISSINWKELGIEEVFQADDGVNGLEMALTYKPEIILCDVRMPRMTGIAMLEKIEKALPYSVPIFMSGYSDKEYLKAAIKLKAVNYIEKPINLKEIQEAILEAKELYNQKLRSHREVSLHSMETASHLALLLTSPYSSNKEKIEQLAQELSLPLSSGTCFASVIVHLSTPPELITPSPKEIYRSLKDFLHPYHTDCIYVAKRLQYLVYFIFSSSGISDTLLKNTGKFLDNKYTDYGNHFVAVGNTFSGISKAQQSYTSAVLLLQNSFFFPVNSVLTPEVIASLPVKSAEQLPSAPESVFAEYLSTQNRDGCFAFLESLAKFYERNSSVLPDQAKDLYYKLSISLENARKQQQLSAVSQEQNSVVSFLEKCFTYQELHSRLAEQTEAYFTALENALPENPTIFLIKDYIGKNYMNETLSVKDISTQVFLSASYVCTFFKNETGQTLNQYLTEYRMEKAKMLLADPRYKIADISSKVGYSDGNYFGKSFKKYTGLSPSEYREKII